MILNIHIINRFYHACEICGHPFATVHDKIDHLEGHVEHATTQCCYCHLCKKRFDSLEDLIKAINNDISIAESSLSEDSELLQYAKDDFFL